MEDIERSQLIWEKEHSEAQENYKIYKSSNHSIVNVSIINNCLEFNNENESSYKRK